MTGWGYAAHQDSSLRTAVPAGACKSAMEIRDHVVKFADNDDGIFIVKSAGANFGLCPPMKRASYRRMDQFVPKHFYSKSD